MVPEPSLVALPLVVRSPAWGSLRKKAVILPKRGITRLEYTWWLSEKLKNILVSSIFLLCMVGGRPSFLYREYTVQNRMYNMLTISLRINITPILLLPNN